MEAEVSAQGGKMEPAGRVARIGRDAERVWIPGIKATP